MEDNKIISIIEQELEKYEHKIGFLTQIVYTQKDIKLVIQKAREELKKNRECQRGYPHICQKNSYDCDYMVEWEDIERVMGK